MRNRMQKFFKIKKFKIFNLNVDLNFSERINQAPKKLH